MTYNHKSIPLSLASLFLLAAAGQPLTAHADHTYQTTNIVNLNTGNMVKGAATLTRTMNSATARIYTSQLRKKGAYTIWWVIWNDPSECSGDCGEDDIGITGNSVFYAGGFVTGTDGTANVSVQVDGGDLADGIDVLIPGGLAESNGFGAEIHLVIRSHGKVKAGLAADQIGSFNGACDVNNCFDHQAAVFPPVAP